MKIKLHWVIALSVSLLSMGCDGANDLGKMLDNIYNVKLLEKRLLKADPTPAPPVIPNDKSFNVTDVVLGSDGKLYFSDNDANVVKQWDISTETVTIIAAFEDSAHAMFASEDRNKLYLADNKRIFEYDCTSGTLTQKYNSPSYIQYIYPAGNNIIVCHGAYQSTDFLNRLVRISDFSELDFMNGVDPSRSSAYSPLRDRVYLINEFSGNFYVSYQIIDTIGESLGIFSWIVGYSTSHSGNPIKIFPDQSRLAVATGRVVVIDDTSKNEDLCYDYSDLAFGPDGSIYLLHNLTVPDFGIRCRLIKLEGSDPYGLIGVPQEFTMTGRKLIVDDDRLIIVIQDASNNNEIDVVRYPFSEL